MKWKFLFAALIAIMFTAATASEVSAQCRRPHYRVHYYHHYHHGYYGPRAVVVVRPGYGYYHRPPRYYHRDRYYAYGPRPRGYYHPRYREYHRRW